jgi:anaerobic magnesium-protoporphyrin IX monomethyl ester cyclase
VIRGLDPSRPADAIFVNAPLRDYAEVERKNDYTLPVLGLGYIATYAAHAGFNVGVLDIESAGLSIVEAARLIRDAAPRWVGANLLAPTYENSVAVLRRLPPEIMVMLGGHHAKAMPERVLGDGRIPRIDAMVLGEGELRVAALLANLNAREELERVWWRTATGATESRPSLPNADQLAPPIDSLPLLDRTYMAQDPFVAADGRTEANMVGSRGCPYNCSFCGAAVSANPDVDIRTRQPNAIADEMEHLADTHGVTAFRFVDDLFLARPPFMRACAHEFTRRRFGERFVWDATGRINVLDKQPDELIETLRESGLREVALGIESGSDQILERMDKRITAAMARRVTERLISAGVNVKGYFIVGYPGESRADLDETIRLIEDLWSLSDVTPGEFRASAFEFRPYPGTPVWHELIKAGYTEDDLLRYDVPINPYLEATVLDERDEFNFSVGLQFGEVPLDSLRGTLARIGNEQYRRRIA